MDTTQEEVRKKFAENSEKLVAAIDGLLLKAATEMTIPVQRWFSHLRKIILTQNEELSIHREMEELVRKNSLSEEIVQDIMKRLTDFRLQLAADNAAPAEKTAEQQEE